MKRLQSFLTLFVLLLVSVSASWAATITVGPGKMKTKIQEAVTIASGGDIIEVYTDIYTENVNIPGGKNGLIIRAASGQTPELDGSGIANPRVAFRIASDNVTISGFKIKNYNYGPGATNVDYGQAQRGAGIESINASSQHTFTGNTITNCNWGIYVREGNNITVQNNYINDFVATSFVGTWNQQGGVGIAFLSNGIAMDGNIIKNDTLDNDGSTGNFGIAYGRIGANVGADFVEITGNQVKNGTNAGFFAYGIFNILSGESVDFSANSSMNCNAAVDIYATVNTDNDDVTITNNSFVGTLSTVEFRAQDAFRGFRLWEIMITNGNTFKGGSDLSNAIASVQMNEDIITTDGNHRFILNNLDAAITEAEDRLNGAAANGRVYVTNGTYVSTGTATVNGAFPNSDKLKIQGESTLAIITNSTTWAGTLIDIQKGDVEVDPLTFMADLTFGNVTAISTSAPSTHVHDVEFKSTMAGANSYIGIQVNDAANNATIENNKFYNKFSSGVLIESNNTVKATIECNEFVAQGTVSAIGINIKEITLGGNITNIDVLSNTFGGASYSNVINIELPTAGSGSINIGNTDKGNIFTCPSAYHIYLTQLADNQVTIKSNKIGGTAIDFINNTTNKNVNAGFNYWNVLTPYAVNVPGMIDGLGAANVTWLPIYTSDEDQSLDCGFQPKLTSLWTPVYTAEVLNDPITDTDNRFFLTIADALNDSETDNTDPDPNLFVYVYLDQDSLGGYTYNETALLTFQSDDILLSSAPSQPAKLTEPNPLVTSSNVGPIVDVNNDDITINNLEFDHTAGNTYQIYVSNATQDGLTITNCEFDATSVNGITFVAGATSNTEINDNEFALGGSNFGIDFNTTATNTNSKVEIDGNTFSSSVNTTTAIRFGQVDNLELTDNKFQVGINFVAGATNTTKVNIYGNSFLSTVASVPVAMNFYHDNVVAGIYDEINIEQNQIHEFDEGINIEVVAANAVQVGQFANWTINENYFAEIGGDGIDINGLAPLAPNVLDATDNYWGSNYGPQAESIAPAWHDEAGNPITSNSFGYLYNTLSGANIVVLTDATYIQFAPWWNDNAGSITNPLVTPGNYLGTSFAPIENNVLAPNTGYFASLIFAIDGTVSGSEIYLQDVPNWTGSPLTGNLIYYVEKNTVQNAGKNLDIWGQPLWQNDGSIDRPTTKIATSGNGAADDMFLFENGTVNINFLEFVYADAGDDFESAVEYGLNAIGSIDWSSFNGIEGTSTDLYVVFASNATTQLNVSNSIFLNNTHSIDVENIVADNGAALIVDNVNIKGNNGTTTIASYEVGIGIYNGSDLTLTNSTIYNMTTGGTDNNGIYLSAPAVAPGTIQIYQNIIEDNQYGLWIGDGSVNDNYSASQIYNNIIRDNEFGLRYEPDPAGAVSILNVENNYWDSNNGPRSEAQIGATQENTYNETAQGDAVVDANSKSNIDFLPWRRLVAGDDLATMISGPRFAPIVRTNNANLMKGLYSNFNDAIADLTATQKVFVYAGTYSEHISLNKGDAQFIGKLAPATYSAGWIIAPNSVQFQNAWTANTQGANVNAPVIISGGLAQPLLVDAGAMFDNVSFKGFIFDTKVKATPTYPYNGNPTKAIEFGLNTDNITFSNNTFQADLNDRAISWGAGQHDNWKVTYNKYDAKEAGHLVWLNVSTINSDILISNNYSDYGAIYINKGGAGRITNIDINYNEFDNTLGAITLNGTAGAPADVISNMNINNNVFKSTNTFAFLVDGTADNSIVNADDWTTNVQFTNNEVLIPYNAAQLVVGFANPTPLVKYSNEMTATCNWWGSAFGPTYDLNPGGNGGLVSDAVFFAPWLNGNAELAPVFGFEPNPAVVKCEVGDRVWVNSTPTADPTVKTIVFPSLQWAVEHASVVNGTNFNIFVSDDYNKENNDAGTDWVEEDINIDWLPTTNVLFTETPANELKINGDFELDGSANVYNLWLGSPLRVTGDLILDNIGCQGWIMLGEMDLTVEGHITEGYFINAGQSCQINTDGSGYLIKEKVVTGGINNFPIFGAGISPNMTGTPARFVVNASGFDLADNHKIKVRVEQANPVDYKGMGEDGYDINNIWKIEFENNTASNKDPLIAMELRYLALSPAEQALYIDANYNPTISYGAYWDMNGTGATQWTTKKSTSSWNGSDGIQVTNLNLTEGPTDWAIFSGSTSFALSDAPTQAKNIQWISGDDRNLKFQWQRNGTDNQYYAIMGVKGTMVAPPADPFNPIGTGIGTSSPWVASATSRNFSDGYVDNISLPSWTSGKFHNLAATPADVKVLKVGKYGAGLTENVTVTDLDQGTYYTFFVANFNYGDGTTPIANMVTGTDGMANYNLEDETLNPRTRKTQPAVYMTLDVPSFPGDAIVYGTTLPTLTDLNSMFTTANHWRQNNLVTGNVPVNNQYNGDDLIGGNYAQLCQPTSPSANFNVNLYFKAYGNNGGANWGIKYSENNSTYTFTTPFVNSNTTRSRNIETKYYLVSAYDGDGKVAVLYDNNKDLQIIFDQEPDAGAAFTTTMPSCAGNNVTALASSISTSPAATFVQWEMSDVNKTNWTPIGGGESNTFALNYADNGKFIRAKYQSWSVCSWNGTSFNRDIYSDTLKLEIYDNTLVGTQPKVGATTTPYLCKDGLTSVTFTTEQNNDPDLPKDMKLQGWYLSTDNGISWNPTIINVTPASYGPATVNSLTGIGTTTGSIEISNANMSLLDSIQVKAIWQNGNCATTETAVTTLNIVDSPVITALTTPAGKCMQETIQIASTSTPANSGATQTIQWQYSTDNVTFNNLNNGTVTVGTTDVVTISGATTATLSITPLTLDWDGYYFKVIYTHSENGTNCIEESNAVQIDVLPTPDFVEITDKTVCQNSTFSVTAQDVVPATWSGNNLTWWTNTTPDLTGTPVAIGGSVNGTSVSFSGALNQTITFNNIQPNAGWATTYIIVKDVNSCTGFEAFKVTVDEQPVITGATITPANPTEVCEGGLIEFEITYTPTSTTDVKWYYQNTSNEITTLSITGNGRNMPSIITAGGTSTLQLTDVTYAIHGDNFFAVVDNGTCNVVQSANLTPVIETIPVAPTTVGAQNIFSHRFDVTWTAVANADSYDIQVSEFANFGTKLVDVNIAAPAISWNLMGNCVLQPAKTYYFRVRARNQCSGIDDNIWRTSNLVTLDPTVTKVEFTSGNGNFGDVPTTPNPSASQTYSIEYYQLDAGLEVTVPAYYQIKPQGSLNWIPAVVSNTTTTVDLTPYLTLYLGTPSSKLNLNVDVQFDPTVCGTFAGNLTHTTLETCAGVTEMLATTVSVTGNGVTSAPTTNASNGIALENTANQLDLTWTNGGGNQRLVILSTTPTLSAAPVNNTTYTVGQTIGGGTIVGVTPTQPLTVTGLTAGINYYIHVWEYNECNPGTEQYDSDSYMFQPYYLKFATDIPDQLIGEESGNVTINFTQRDRTLINNPFGLLNVTIGTFPPVPSNGSFTTNPSVSFAANAQTTTFKFTWIDSCGFEDGYLTATATNVKGFNVLNDVKAKAESNTFKLDINTPTMQSRIVVWVGVPCYNSTKLKWTNGDGYGRLVVVREGALPIAPNPFQVYVPENDWLLRDSLAQEGTNGNLLGSDSYVMGAIQGDNQIEILHLETGKTYYFRVYEYNGCDPQLRKYLTTNATFNPRSRTINCKEGNNLYDIVLDRFNATSNSGKGLINFNTLYEANISGFELRRINLTDEEMNGVLVGSYMSNSELVAEGNTMTGKSYGFTDNSSLLEVGKTYLYQLTAIAFDGTRIDVAETELTINDDIYTGISQFSISPVTVTNTEARFDVTVEKAQNVTITMYDVTGQKVASIANDTRVNRGTQQFTTNIQNVTNGTYMIVVEAADGVSALQKFQIVR